MALKREDLTEEQKKAVSKLYKKFSLNVALIMFLYFCAFLAGNLVVAMLDALYVHSKQFNFLLTFGTTLIIFNGMIGTLKECQEAYLKKFSEILPKD